MKTCPFCQAAMEESARFCVYCMSPLTEKQPVAPLKVKKPWGLWTVGTVGVLLVLSLIVFWVKTAAPLPDASITGETVSKAPPSNTLSVSAATELTTEAPPSDTPTSLATTTHTTEASPSDAPTSSATTTHTTAVPPSDAPTASAATTLATKAPPPVSAVTPTAKHTDAPSVKTTAKAATAVTTTTTTRRITTTTIPGTTTTATTTRPIEEEPVETIRWQYRAAYASDYDGSVNGVPVSQAIVLTGFSTLPSNGIYVVPAAVGGKTVVALELRDGEGYTFRSDEVRDAVRAVYLPPALTRVAAGTFADCPGLSDLFVSGEALYAAPSVFTPPEQRRQTLTIHCSRTCRCLYSAKYFSVYCSRFSQNDYHAAFREWSDRALYE